jgi:hypothetical protein
LQHSSSPRRGELRADTRNVAATNRDIASRKERRRIAIEYGHAETLFGNRNRRRMLTSWRGPATIARRASTVVDMQRRLTSSTRMHDALVAFLDSHIGEAHSDDVGPLFGQASEIRDHGFADAEVKRLWNEAVNVAVSSEAIREIRSRRGAVRRGSAVSRSSS